MAQTDEEELVLSGEVRPPNIPPNWLGAPLPESRGWRWFDPDDRGNSVRIYRADPSSANPVDHETYVVVTVKGELIDAAGKFTGEFVQD